MADHNDNRPTAQFLAWVRAARLLHRRSAIPGCGQSQFNLMKPVATGTQTNWTATPRL
jgi:hypothetical protein